MRVKTLRYDLVKNKINDLLKQYGHMLDESRYPYSLTRSDCVILGLINSINEIIDPSWTGKIIASNYESIYIKSGKKKWALDKDKPILCEKDKGFFLDIRSPDGVLFEVRKKCFYLCEE